MCEGRVSVRGGYVCEGAKSECEGWIWRWCECGGVRWCQCEHPYLL